MNSGRSPSESKLNVLALFLACPVLIGCGDPSAECYSPVQNLDRAYETGAVGCRCDDAADVCVGGVALICNDSRWQAVEDGPCAPMPELCADGEIVESSGACLQDDAFCRQLPDGRYCTGSAEPHCPQGSEPIARDAECPPYTDCFDFSESLRCARRAYTPEECAAVGGNAIADPGDGSLLDGGCPSGAEALGFIEANWDEGGLCCQAAKRCGARAGMTCTSDEYCAYVDGQYCGAADAEAVCKRKPSACDLVLSPVCGCDGKTYDNACVANAAGSGILSNDPCK